MSKQLQVREVNIQRILNPTSIDLGEFVINPYKGCELACSYCYVKTNRVTAQNPEVWGSYVDVRLNSPEQLEKELVARKVSTVLLGSTTECFQPVEKQYRLTEKILQILNNWGIYYVILTRSPAILNALPLLTQGFCKKIYFTVNFFDEPYKRLLEAKSADFKSRARSIEELINSGLNVVTYFCPVLPWISDVENAFAQFGKSDPIEFEFLNFNLKHIDEILKAITSVDPELGARYKAMKQDKEFFTRVWDEIRLRIESGAKEAGKSCKIYEHSYEGFFENKYT